VSFSAQLAAYRAGRSDAEDLARAALAEGEEEAALPLVAQAAERGRDARLWQFAGLLQRSLDEHADALASFAAAARLAPDDASIAQGHAQVALETGLDAVALFDRARALAPTNGEVLTGRAAALTATGRGESAAAELDAILVQAPGWVAGHEALAQLRATLGQGDDATASLNRALAAYSSDAALWRTLFELHLRAEKYEVLAEATRGTNRPEWFRDYAAIAAAELGHDAQANRLPPLWRIRHLLRTGRLPEASALIDRELAGDGAAAVWPYAAAAWRLAGDPRAEWLMGDARLVATTDLALDPALADTLRALHVAKGEYLDQSVRGGTQTDGPLLSRIDPQIRAVRTAIAQAVADYVARLPAPDPAHPLLAPRRDRRIRFAGSWSVRLRGGGHHANHVHPQGWISSALYVALPERRPEDDPHAGWLTLGEPQAALKLDLAPARLIEPRVGRLVLFPSWMWHGTRPFAAGERLTMAFDVAPPR
jgi:hypothetical protein